MQVAMMMLCPRSGIVWVMKSSNASGVEKALVETTWPFFGSIVAMFRFYYELFYTLIGMLLMVILKGKSPPDPAEDAWMMRNSGRDASASPISSLGNLCLA